MTIHQTTIRPAVTPAEQRFLDLYASVSGKLPGAGIPSVRAWRQAALDAFTKLGLPHRRVEEWKYTDLRTLMTEVRPLAGLTPPEHEDLSIEDLIGKPLAHLDAYRAVFVSGRFRADLSTIQNAPGLGFEPLQRSLQHDAASAQAIERLPLSEKDVIAALSAAFATDGAVLAIAHGAQLEKPIHFIFISSDGSLHALQHAISIGEGAKVSLLETHAGAANSQAISAMRIAVGKRASLKHVRLTMGACKHLASSTITLGEESHYEPLQVAVDGTLLRAGSNIRFDGPKGRLHYAGAMLLRGHAHADFTLVVDHAAPGCESRELVKAVLDGRSRGVFQGKVIVQRGAQKTDGKQMAKALLLSDEAEFDSKPELEIFADDVVCGHGSTAGQLDDDMMFYLRARGIPEAEARSLLIAAFIGETLDRIDDEALRTALDEKVAAWLAEDPTMLDPAI